MSSKSPKPILHALSESSLDAALIHSIGVLTAEWAYAESTMELLIWTLAHVDPEVGRCFTTHMTAVAKKEVADSLALEVLRGDGNAAIREKVEETIKAFNDLRIERNKVIHAFWKLEKKDGKAVALRVTARKGLEFAEDLFDFERVRHIATRTTSWLVMTSDAISQLPPLPTSAGRLLVQVLRERSQNRDHKASK